eukprot:1201429-Prymnesium_polylepis.1
MALAVSLSAPHMFWRTRVAAQRSHGAVRAAPAPSSGLSSARAAGATCSGATLGVCAAGASALGTIGSRKHCVSVPAAWTAAVMRNVEV